MRRDPPLHHVCSDCQIMYHNRCIQIESPFVCDKCKPAESVPANSVSSPSTPSVSPSSPPSQRIAPASTSCCDELLLTEGDLGASCLPSYVDFVNKFDGRMTVLGFQRSPSEKNTPADGNCGVHALVDQLNLPRNESTPMFDTRDNCFFARYLFIKKTH